MNKKNLVAATLAIGAMLGFLSTLAFLAVKAVPVENKDYFNMALVALIGFLGTAFGYYLGSSMGSAAKNDLIARPSLNPAPPVETLHATSLQTPPETAPAMFTSTTTTTGDAGCIRLPLLFLLAAFACIIALTGCATSSPPNLGGAGGGTVSDTPLQTAGKSLLAVKSTIVTAATATDSLCKAGKIAPDNCSKAKTAYEVAKPAYDTAVDAYLLMSSGGGDAANFGAALLRVQNLAAHLLQLSGGAQ